MFAWFQKVYRALFVGARFDAPATCVAAGMMNTTQLTLVRLASRPQPYTHRLRYINFASRMEDFLGRCGLSTKLLNPKAKVIGELAFLWDLSLSGTPQKKTDWLPVGCAVSPAPVLEGRLNQGVLSRYADR